MSKIILLGDTHFGARNDNPKLANRFELFYDFMFQYMKDESIDRIVQFGDLFDRRKYINFASLGRCKEYFFNPIRDNGFHMDTFVGNHDIPYKNTLKYNSPSLILGEYSDCINLITEPTSLQLDINLSAAVIPWMCDDNMQECLTFIDQSKDSLCFGHFEMAGFEFTPGTVCEHGISKDLFWKFHHVYSGHFHHISTQDNVTFIGSPCQLTWSDYADPRGFFILDTDTLTTEFIENPYENFHKILYDDTKMTLEDIAEMDFEPYRDTYIKVVIRNNTDMLMYDTLIDKLVHAADVKIVDDHMNKDDTPDEEIITDADDINETFRKSSQQYHGSCDPDRVFKALVELYKEASEEE